MALGVIAAAPSLVYLRGFTVDDALIPARYAANIARGLGYRFNPSGPSTDGVTPLGWAYVLAPFAAHGPLAALRAARVLGWLAWLGAAGALGAAVAAASPSRWRYLALVLLLGSAPLGAWASSGLETGLVVALCTWAAVLPARARWSSSSAAFAGAAAWLRPEMIAYAVVLGAGRARLAEDRRARAFACMLAVVPWCAAASIRWVVWGRPAPLAVLAKPSDLAHGLTYVVPAIWLTGAPLAVLAPLAWKKLALWPRTLIAGAFVHLATVALVGGDWMPLARLVCPVVPSLVLVDAHFLSLSSGALASKLRLIVALAGEVSLFIMRGPAAARVFADRAALIEAATPVLATAERVATIDVGWVGAATEAEIVDLAGATDPDIAALPGGHTSKAVSGAFLTQRQPDRLVFQLASCDPKAPGCEASAALAPYARATEQRLAVDPLIAPAYRSIWESPQGLPIRYVVLSKSYGRD